MSAVEKVEGVELLERANLRSVLHEPDRFVITLNGHTGTEVHFEIAGVRLAALLAAMAKDLLIHVSKPTGKPS